MSPLIHLVLWNSGCAAVLAAVAFFLGRLPAFQRRPALLHILWFGVLLRLIVPSFVPIPVLPGSPMVVRVDSDMTDVLPRNISVSVAPSSVPPPPDTTFDHDGSARSPWPDWSFLWVSVSLAGTAALLLICIGRGRRIARLLRESQAAPPRLVEAAAQLAHGLHIAVTPSVRLVEGLASPSIWIGWRRATILLPRHLINALDDEQWRCILAHELAHLARRDHWFNLAAAGVVHLYWWNPIAWWAWREMQAHQEGSCDAMAIAHEPQSRRLYAETLLQVVDSWNRTPLFQPQVLLGFGNRSVLTRRFEMIANPSVRPRAAVVATACLALGALSFVCLPVRAEKKEPAAADQQKSSAADDAQKPAAPEVTDEEVAKLKKQSRDNIKHIMLAMHIYHDKHGSFPPPILYGKDNKGGTHPHSWRVALLPYLDQAKLYESYKFDEPWDSNANIDVMAKMPDVYRAPGEEPKFFHPAYVVLVGKLLDDDSDPAKLQTCFSSKKGVRIPQIQDGTSNTLMVVEAKMEGKRAIQWTEPKDIAYDPAAKLPELGLQNDGFFAGMGDGSVRFVSKTVKESTVKAVISPAGGEAVDGF